MSRRTSFGLISLKNSFPTMLFLGIAKRFPLFVIFSTHAVGDLPNLSEAKLTTMIKKSIPYLEQKGVEWIEQKNCVSCHRIGNMIWSLSKARQQGFKVSEQLDQWIKWSVDVSLNKDKDGKPTGLSNQEGVAQLILGQEDVELQKRSELIGLLKEGQEPDGCWSPGGQLPMQKRSKLETKEASTMWIALSLKNYAPNAFESALANLKGNLGKSTEWIALKLMISQEIKDANSTDHYLKLLLKSQNHDGGWGWLISEQSDAFATGMVLYALEFSGPNIDRSPMTKARSFLFQTQNPDGSWSVPSTKRKKKESIEETASYWGTSWAVLGLLHGLEMR